MRVTLKNFSCTRGDGANAFTVKVNDLSISSGEIVIITGDSGSGKSTLMEALGLILRPNDDSIFTWDTGLNAQTDIIALWKNADAAAMSYLRSNIVGFVLQTGGLLPFLTVRENIMLPRMLRGVEWWCKSVDGLVRDLEIRNLLTRKPHQLSIGERQRVAIARALSHDPQVFLADEPTAALDPKRAEVVMRMITDLVRERNILAIVVTHRRMSGVYEIRAMEENGGHGSCFAPRM